MVPATQHIYEAALQEGLIETFIKYGCFVSGPTCGACLGMSCGVIAPGEVCVSTTNRNFRGRMGEGGMVHLASPATAAITAINGFISQAQVGFCQAVASRIEAVASRNFSYRQWGLDYETDWKKNPSQRPDYGQLLKLFGAGEVKDFSGKVSYLPADNVDTDQIIPAKYLTETDKSAFGKHCLEDAPVPPEDRPKLFGSQILVAGENFGCGSSREHAPWALESAGIRCVIAPSFARIFENNMFANGLLCVTLPASVMDLLWKKYMPESININWERGVMEWGDDGTKFELSDYQKELIRNGGSVGVMVKLASELQKEGKLR